MRKYGRLFFVLAVLAAVPAAASADGFPQESPTPATQKQLNQQKAEQIASALTKARVNGYNIEIEVVGDVVTLTGKVRERGHRALAGAVCRKHEGIRRVRNNLEYVQSGKIQQASAESGEPAAELPESAAIRDRQVRAAVFETTPSAEPQIQQVEFTEFTPDTAVDNQQMAQRIATSLSKVGLTGYDIEISYQNGVATLSGTVATAAQCQFAAAAAGRVPGVKNVQNRLQTTGPVAQTGYMPAQTPYAPGGDSPQVAGSTHQRVASASMGAQAAAAPAAIAGAGVFSNPHLPAYAWPAYAQYPNSAAVTYPTQYSASAFPYIGPFYPYPQVPLDWREAKLEWDDGLWRLNFNRKKDVFHWLFQTQDN